MAAPPCMTSATIGRSTACDSCFLPGTSWLSRIGQHSATTCPRLLLDTRSVRLPVSLMSMFARDTAGPCRISLPASRIMVRRVSPIRCQYHSPSMFELAHWFEFEIRYQVFTIGQDLYSVCVGQFLDVEQRSHGLDLALRTAFTDYAYDTQFDDISSRVCLRDCLLCLSIPSLCCACMLTTKVLRGTCLLVSTC
jgi:hypothetical protein